MKKYSLALWWGAARGLIHIGVLKYLEEKNIKIDEIAWTSMWAIIAALIAIWKDSKYIENFAKNINYFSLLDFDLKTWILKWEKVYKLLEKEFWDKKIEDCNIPLKIVATDIENALSHIFEKWKILDALRASISLPWVFAPYEIDWIFYVDGWVLMNLPIQALTWENIIAVSALKVEKWEIIQTKEILWFKFKTWFWKNNYKILSRSVCLLMKSNEDISLQTPWKNIVFIRPNFWKLDVLHFNKVDEFVKLGYESIKNVLEN